MLNIYEYFDYRKYLREIYEEGKKEHSYFSYRYIAQKVGIDPGYLVKVLQGKWHIAEKSIPDFAKFCKLDEREKEYFETLVQFGKAKTEGDAKRYFELLLNFREVKLKTLAPYQYEFYRKWYHSALRAILGYYSFDGDYALLGQQLSPPITEKQARESIELLEKLSLIQKDDYGNYSLTDNLITTGEEWSSLAVQEFQKSTIQIAKDSFERHKKSDYDISTVTMAISKDILDEIRERAREFRSSVIKLANDCEVADAVYQLNVQVVPLTNMDEEGQDETV